MMITTHSYLFVYGTLLINGNKHASYLQKQCKLIKKGKFKGRLYNIGEYPGAVTDEDDNNYVHGLIYLMDKLNKVLNLIDDYEGISIHEPHPQEYRRVLMDVKAEDEILKCWVYLYNWPVNGLEEIFSGDYIQHQNNKEK